jgi:hypothetical protein
MALYLSRSGLIDTTVQKAFMRGISGCTDHNLVLQELLAFAREKKKTLHCTFFDPTPFFYLVFSRFFSGVGGDGGRGSTRRSPDSLSCWNPVYMLSDKTWRKPDRVITSLKYGKRTHQRNPADVFYHLSNT